MTCWSAYMYRPNSEIALWGKFPPPPPLATLVHLCASESSDRASIFFLHFHNLKLPFLSIFCRYFGYFVGTNDTLVGLHVPTKLRNSIMGEIPPPPPGLRYAGYATTLRGLASERSVHLCASMSFDFFLHFHNLKLPFLSIFCRYFRYFVGTNDMQITFCRYRPSTSAHTVGTT